MRRLWRYMEGRKLAAVLMIAVGTANAAAQTGGWLLVRDAIDNGIVAGVNGVRGAEHHLTIVILIYLGVAAAGWILQAWLIRGLATIGQAITIGLRRDLFD